METDIKYMYDALCAFSTEAVDRNWPDMNIQELGLDEISILKTLECVLPKNVFLTVDYDIQSDDETDMFKPDSELADYMHEEEAVIKENGALQEEYRMLFDKCFIKDDGSEAVKILSECKRNDPEGHIKELIGSEHPMPFLFEKLELYQETEEGEYERGWNFSAGRTYKALFEENSGIPGLEVNVMLENGDYFRLDAEGHLWTENEDLQEWHKWNPVSAKRYDRMHTEAEANLTKTLYASGKKNIRKRRNKKDEGEKDDKK